MEPGILSGHIFLAPCLLGAGGKGGVWEGAEAEDMGSATLMSGLVFDGNGASPRVVVSRGPGPPPTNSKLVMQVTEPRPGRKFASRQRTRTGISRVSTAYACTKVRGIAYLLRSVGEIPVATVERYLNIG